MIFNWEPPLKRVKTATTLSPELAMLTIAMSADQTSPGLAPTSMNMKTMT
jgi:hypothetical protein